MKRVAAAMALIVTLILASAFLWREIKMQPMEVQLNIKDLPEHKVKIIAPSDPSFNKRTSAFLKNCPPKMAELIKPFSVLIESASDLAIVGTRLNWEIVKSDGKIVNMPVGSANPKALMEMDETRLAYTVGGAAIPPHSTRFVSLIGSAGEGQEVDLNDNWLAFRGSQSETEEFLNMVNRGNREEAFKHSLLARTLQDAISITVSVDGIFFEDGTFAGDDKTGFFNEIKSYIDAQYDWLTEISAIRKQGKTPDEIFSHVSDFLAMRSQAGKEGFFTDNQTTRRAIGNQRASDLASNKPSNSAYDFYKTMYAQQLLSMKASLGASKSLAQALKLLNKPRIELRKK